MLESGVCVKLQMNCMMTGSGHVMRWRKCDVMTMIYMARASFITRCIAVDGDSEAIFSYDKVMVWIMKSINDLVGVHDVVSGCLLEKI